jgi:hypothetical protein
LADDQPLHQRMIIAMRDGDAFAVERQFAEAVKTPDANRFRIPRQLSPIEVVIAPDECGGDSGELIDDLLGSDVAAVNQVLSASGAKNVDGRLHRVEAVVGIAKDSEQHSG